MAQKYLTEQYWDATELAGLNAVVGAYNLRTGSNLLAGSLLVEKSADIDIGTIGQSGDTFFYDVAPDTPLFFLLKFGGGKKKVTFTDYYFANIADLSKLVFTNAQVDNVINFADCSDGSCRLSHYTIFNSPFNSPTPSIQLIPEPALPLLLGVGLMGFYLARRA